MDKYSGFLGGYIANKHCLLKGCLHFYAECEHLNLNAYRLCPSPLFTPFKPCFKPIALMMNGCKPLSVTSAGLTQTLQYRNSGALDIKTKLFLYWTIIQAGIVLPHFELLNQYDVWMIHYHPLFIDRVFMLRFDAVKNTEAAVFPRLPSACYQISYSLSLNAFNLRRVSLKNLIWI